MRAPHPASTLLGLGCLIGGGTLASAVVCAVWLLLPPAARPWVCPVALVMGTAATRLGAASVGGFDDRRIVSDEVAGMGLVSLGAWHSPVALVAGFVVFRLLDILKPGPVRRAENLPGWIGILADDLVAGALAAAAALVVGILLARGGG